MKKIQKSNDIYGVDQNCSPIYRVEEANPPVYAEEPYTVLPQTVDFSRVIQNIMKALTFLKDKKNDQKYRYDKWQGFLKMSENIMVVSDLFWLTICKFFLKSTNEIENTQQILEKRIAKNFINFFIRVDDKYEKDDFFKKYFDILSQAVFYSLFYAYPKSRHKFNDDLKHKLIEFFSEKFTGIKISSTYGYYDKWCLDLGAGNIFKIDRQKFCQTAQHFRDTDNQNMPNIKRVQKLVRYSPIVAQYLDFFQYKTKNYLKEFKMKITEYQDKKEIDQQFQNYSNRVNLIKQNSKHYVKVYADQKKELTKQIKLIKRETLTHQHRLEKRKVDELEKGTNEYANYLVSMLNSGINIEPNKNQY